MGNNIVNAEGFFKDKCVDCIHSVRTWEDKGNPDKDNREMYCGMYRKKFYPKNLGVINCSHYKMKLWSKIKRILTIILTVYLVAGFLQIILRIF